MNTLKNHFFLGENKDGKLASINVKTPKNNLNRARATQILINDPNTCGYEQYKKNLLKANNTGELMKCENEFS